MKHFPFILALIISLFGSFLFIASAQNYVPLAPLPIGEGGVMPPSYTMTTYLSGAIKLLLAIGASVAVLMTIIGGTQYVASGISPDAKSKAKGMITNAFIGLALMLLSYLILNSINPKLVQFNLSLEKTEMKATEVTPVVLDRKPFSTPEDVVGGDMSEKRKIDQAIKDCGVIKTPFSLILNTESAKQMEATKGGTPIWKPSGVNQDVITNLEKLRAAVDKLNTALAKKGNASAIVTSAYRPYEYQKHLYDIYKAWKVDGLEKNTEGECNIAKIAIGNEYRSHELGDKVANPDSQSAPHMVGTGVDIKLTGIRDEEIQDFIDKGEIALCWQNIPGDPWHFNLKQSPQCPLKN